jgi:hypothetical protein
MCCEAHHLLLQVVAQLVDGFWHWIEGPHGRWFDKLLGAVHALIALFIFLGNAAVLKVVQGRTAKDAKGFLDYKLDAENAMRTLPSMLDKLTKIMNQVSPAMSKHTEALIRAKSTAEQLRVSEAAASSLDKYSMQVDILRRQLMKMAVYCQRAFWDGPIGLGHLVRAE